MLPPSLELLALFERLGKKKVLPGRYLKQKQFAIVGKLVIITWFLIFFRRTDLRLEMKGVLLHGFDMDNCSLSKHKVQN